MTSIAYITQFRSTTLHNGTDRYAVNVLHQSPVAKLKIIQLPDGTLYDGHETGDAPTAPAAVTAVFLLRMGTPTAANTEFEALAAMVGQSGTLTAKKADGTTTTCTARLKRVTNVSKYRDRMLADIKVKLEFQPTTKWV